MVLRFPAGPTTASFDSQIAWSPDGASLWMYIPDLSTSSETENTSAADGPPNGATLYRVSTSGDDAQSAGRVDASRSSGHRTGRGLPTRAGADGALDLFLANADGANPQLYASLGTGGFTNWSPDGTRFIYTDTIGPMVSDPTAQGKHLSAHLDRRRSRWERARRWLTRAGSRLGNCWRCTTPGQTGCWSERTLDGAAVDGSAVGIQPLPRGVTYDVTRP